MSNFTTGGLTCLEKATELLSMASNSDWPAPPADLDSLEALEVESQARGMRPARVADWPEVDAALEAQSPVVLRGDPAAQRAHGKRLGMSTEGLKFLLLSKRVSTMFPTSGGPFATETVSYLAHDPHHTGGPVWLCLGELRGYCDAGDSCFLGVSLTTSPQ